MDNFNLNEFIKRERLFVAAAVGLLLILLFSPTGEGIKMVKAPPVGSPFLSPTEVIEAINSGRVSSLVLSLLKLIFVVFLTFLLSGLILNLSGLLQKKWRMFSPGQTPMVQWGMWPVVKILVYFMFLLFLCQITEGAVLDILGLEKAKYYPLLIIGNALIQDVLIIILVFGFFYRFGYSVTSLRLEFLNWYSCFRQAVRGYVIFFPLLILLSVASIIINKALGFHLKSHPLVEPLLEKGGPVFLGALFCIAVFLAPVVEEIFFRGFLYPALKKKLPVIWAILISAVLFSTLHLSTGGWLPILGLGMLLAYSYEKTGSLLVPVFIHAIHNTLFLTYAMLLFKIGKAV